MKVSIVGTGYVGLVSGVGLAAVGHDVICVDVDESKVASINAGVATIYESGLDELLKEVAGKRLRATTDIEEAVRSTEITIIAVGTPFDGESIDLRFIREAACQIGDVLRAKATYHTVIVKSTVVPGTTDSVVLPLLEEASGKRAGTDFGVGMNPEFLREGEAIADFMHPDRIVLGGIDERSCDTLAALYAPFASTETLRTTPRTAEMIKYTANALLATLISFSNEIANLSAIVGVDALEAMRGVHLDKRFTPLLEDGQRVWPGSITYLEGGCGFGGSCIPKDVRALIAFGQTNGMSMDLLGSVIGVNAVQPQRMLDLLARHLPDPEGEVVAVLGMAFKPGTDDIRESPSIAVVEALLAQGATVRVLDPAARKEVQMRFGNNVAYADAIEQAVNGAAAVLVMTRWSEFTDLADVLDRLGVDPIVIDGRRILDPTRFRHYEGIGRPFSV